MSFNTARAIFNQLDVNRDGVIDRNEFSQWAGDAGYGGASTYEAYGGGYGDVALTGAYGGGSSYESSALYGSGGYGVGAVGGAGYIAGGGYDSSAFNSQTAIQTYPTDAQGLFLDSNPQIIRRPAASGVQTYTQNIKVRYLQPPPVPPHGPLIIKEVRPPQPPPPPPLRIRQQAPPLPQPPPLVLREHPPRPPHVVPSQTVIRRLAALPVPPRSVIIERLPPLPPRPRDVIIERWVPYGAQAKRRTIYQRAGPPVQYPHPRNVIIQYEPVPVRVVRQFERFGVSAASPGAYVQQYGGSLLDAGTLVSHARSAGVVEDISPPAGAFIGYGAGAYGQSSGGFVSSSTFEGGYGGDEYVGGIGGGYSTFESSAVSGAEYGGGYGGSYGTGAGLDIVGAAFRSADTNNDGSIDRAEFSRFFQQGL